MSSVGVMSCPWDECDRSNLSPQGHTTHVTFCDHNPNPGVPRSKQKELGMIEDGRDERSPNPDQSASEAPSLPPRDSPSSDKKGSDQENTDEKTLSCPLCDHGEVMDASEAKSAYLSTVDNPHPKVKAGYNLAAHACQNPECAALWGDEFDEAIPMEVIVNA